MTHVWSAARLKRRRSVSSALTGAAPVPRRDGGCSLSCEQSLSEPL